MERKSKLVRKKLLLDVFGFVPLLILLTLFCIPQMGFGQEEKSPLDLFNSLIEKGAKMVRENEFEKVLDWIGELPQEKKSDFRIKVLENSAYLKGYVVTKNKICGKKWQAYYKTMLYSGEKIATPILVELLRDDNLYVRAFTAKALGFLGDQRALEELKMVADRDESRRVRSRAKWAYEMIIGGKTPKESVEGKTD